MNRKSSIIGIILVAVLAGIIYFTLKHRGTPSPVPTEAPPSSLGTGGPCPGETKEFTMEDNFMHGILEKGQKYHVIFNYFQCNKLEHDDLVLYRMSTMIPPTVRIAKGIPGDTFDIEKDEAHHGWNLLINGKKTKTSTGDVYHFGVDAPPMLSIYIKPRNGQIGAGEAIVLSNFPPGDKDSGYTGVISIKDLIGKVEVDKDSVPPTASAAAPAETPNESSVAVPATPAPKLKSKHKRPAVKKNE